MASSSSKSDPAGAEDRRSILARLFDQKNDPRWGTDPEGVSAQALERAMSVLGKIFGPRRYFRITSEGWEKVPESPVLVVANHSGGTSIPDAWGLGYAWYQHFGYDRPVHPLAHDMVFALKLTAVPFSKLGILRAGRDMAVRVLKEWKRDIVVMPGGDVETWRPYRDRYKVRWSGRTGYARLALRAQVPIVPIACAGAHSTLMVLADGHRFARRIGLHKLARSDVFPIHLSLPWGLGIGPLPHIPIPGHFRFKVGDAIYPSELTGDEPTDEQVAAHDARVRAAMQGLLDEHRDEARRRS